ncbi:MAG: PAS domain S-box protein, partial [Euryarchaeota archaeon]|nr:PAS domain S-box protein [Euryarchaeota archaeon]
MRLSGGRLLLLLTRESEELQMYRSFVENSLTGVYILQDNIFRFVNSRMCELTGYSREELVGMDFRKLISPESREVIKGSELRQMHLSGAELVELRGVRKDGSIRDVLVYSVPVTYRGKPAVQGSVIDITELKRAERKLRMLADIAENVSEAICCTDAQGRITYWNAHAEKLFGYSRQELIGRHVSLL